MEPDVFASLIRIDPGSATTRVVQLYRAIRAAVLDGRLAEGAALPSSRRAAKVLGIGRNTVNAAYDLLLADGVIEVRPGARPTVARLERRAAALNLPIVPALDAVTDALSRMLGQEAKARPGRQHQLDAAYFARVEAIQFTVAHDDGIGWENWEQADIVLAGVSRTSKTPTSIYLANRGYKTANIPIVPESPPPDALYHLKRPLVVGLTTSLDRLVQVRRNRLLSLNQAPETAYVDDERVKAEIAYARRMFADNDWPVIDVTRRSIEETAAAVIKLVEDRGGRPA